MNANYLVFKKGLESPRLLPFLFSGIWTHREVANFILKAHPGLMLLSGGACTIDLDSGEVLCYTTTTGLSGLKVLKDDPETLKIEFCSWTEGGGF